nr:hypothetical protein [uncultured Cohaesibacter sp.]
MFNSILDNFEAILLGIYALFDLVLKFVTFSYASIMLIGFAFFIGLAVYGIFVKGVFSTNFRITLAYSVVMLGIFLYVLIHLNDVDSFMQRVNLGAGTFLIAFGAAFYIGVKLIGRFFPENPNDRGRWG